MSKHAIAIATGLLVASSVVRAADAKPNVIFIKTDDQRLDSLSMTGHPVTDKLGLAENTILVFASDHGLLLGEHGLGGKTFLYEESIRIPMIFYSPFFSSDERGQVVDELVVGQDLPATILDLCGLPIPDTYQGRSMVPLIEGRPIEWRKDVFCENLFTDQNYPRMEAVRGTEWKYIRYFSKENDRLKYLPDASINGEQPIFEELFNLNSDPKEQHNLAGNPKYAEVLEAHRKRCQELVTELGCKTSSLR